MHPFHAHAKDHLAEIKRQGRYRSFTPLLKQAGSFPVYDWQGRHVTVWSTNDYLGMSLEGCVRDAGAQAIADHGVGAGGTRNISGTTPYHEALEAELADLHGREAGLLFNSGFVSNQATLAAILNSLPNWHVFSDQKNHASMIAGMKASKATIHIWAHNDLEDLEQKLLAVPDDVPKLIAFESVYSMDADIAPIGAICDLADRFNAMTYLDEVHAAGMYGPQGAGVSARDGMGHRLDVIEATLGKAYGCHGGYIVGDAHLVDYVRSTAPGFIFSTSLPPPIAAAALASVRFLRAHPARREALFQNAALLKAKLAEAGLPVGKTESHIVPIPIGDAVLCREIASRLLEEFGHYATAINYPTVPRGSEKLRLTPTPFHTPEMMDKLIEALRQLLPNAVSRAA